MSATSAVKHNTLKACLQADPTNRSRFATAIHFNSPTDVGPRSSVGARTFITTASTATSISIHLSKPKTIWRYGVQNAVRTWRRRTGKKRPLNKSTCSVLRTPSRPSVKHVHRSQSIRAQSQGRPSPPAHSTETEPQPVIKRTTLTLANTAQEQGEEMPISDRSRELRFSHPLVGVVMSALPTTDSILSFAVNMTLAGRSANTFETQDLQTPRTGDFRGSINPSNVHGRRSDMSREQSDRRLDGLPHSPQVRSNSRPAAPPRAEDQPATATPKLPYVPAQPPFRADSLRSDLNRCSAAQNGPEDAWTKLHQGRTPEIDQADFERFVRGYAGHQGFNGSKPLPSAPARSQYQSYQPGRPALAPQRPFVAEGPLPTPPMPMTPPPPPPASVLPRQPQYQSYHANRVRQSYVSATPFIPRAPMPPTPFTPQGCLRDQDKGKQPADPNHRRASNDARAGPSKNIQERHKRQSQAYDRADLDSMEDAPIQAKPRSIKRKPVPSHFRKIRKSRLQADLPAVPEIDSSVSASSSNHPESLPPAVSPTARYAAGPVSIAATATVVPTAAPAEQLIGGMM
ncbi:hypothetical protein DOTSEDRAFT_30343 [Dothistroma septosporum NZE10]|uniref:Uncharacterized protein n=1 Tax=Dothistroma septosporum (strain NZE10 / CBS 128990) TaxID=675120 RepID=N1Q170_DOTSN|nr:hypothetical protein DOTSEDRAFT_30343 [Dothistroma septosporum NZE10]